MADDQRWRDPHPDLSGATPTAGERARKVGRGIGTGARATGRGLVSLAPVQQDKWWQQSSLLPHFLMVADWSKNLILGLSSQWLASGISAPADLPFKEAFSQPKLPESL